MHFQITASRTRYFEGKTDDRTRAHILITVPTQRNEGARLVSRYDEKFVFSFLVLSLTSSTGRRLRSSLWLESLLERAVGQKPKKPSLQLGPLGPDER